MTQLIPSLAGVKPCCCLGGRRVYILCPGNDKGEAAVKQMYARHQPCDYMELLKLYTALVRRRWLVLWSIVFFTCAAGALAMLFAEKLSVYGQGIGEPKDTSLSILSDLGLGEVAAGLNDESDDIQNKIQMAMSRPVIDDVIWRLQLRDDEGRLYTHEELLVPGVLQTWRRGPISVLRSSRVRIFWPLRRGEMTRSNSSCSPTRWFKW